MSTANLFSLLLRYLNSKSYYSLFLKTFDQLIAGLQSQSSRCTGGQVVTRELTPLDSPAARCQDAGNHNNHCVNSSYGLSIQLNFRPIQDMFTSHQPTDFGIGDGLLEHSGDIQEHCFAGWFRDTLVFVWRQPCYNTKCNVTDTKVVESEAESINFLFSLPQLEMDVYHIMTGDSEHSHLNLEMKHRDVRFGPKIRLPHTQAALETFDSLIIVVIRQSGVRTCRALRRASRTCCSFALPILLVTNIII